MIQIDPQELVRLLREDGVKLRGSGKNLSGLCPFHDDTNASFSVNVEEGLYLCHGCGEKGNAVTYLSAARGLAAADALAYLDRSAPTRTKRPVDTQPKVWRNLPRQNAAGAKCIAVHHYCDADGKRVFAVCRYDKLPADAAQDLKDKWRKCDMWTPRDSGGWVAGRAAKGKKPLYRLPALLKAPESQQVMIVEGEKCADAVIGAFGKAIVTTWSGGIKNEDHTDWSPLHGRNLLLVSDADDRGRNCMEQLAAKLSPHCKQIRIALAPGDDKSDIADWIERGGADEARARLGELTKAAAASDQAERRRT